MGLVLLCQCWVLVGKFVVEYEMFGVYCQVFGWVFQFICIGIVVMEVVVIMVEMLGFVLLICEVMLLYVL